MTRDRKILRNRDFIGWVVTLSLPVLVFVSVYLTSTPRYNQPLAQLVTRFTPSEETPVQFSFHWDVYETEELALEHCDVPIMIVHISSQDTPEWGCPQDENENG